MLQDEDWRDVLAAEDLAPDAQATVRVDGEPLLLRREVDGALSAIANRCPHEGYPLSQGDVKAGVLTCVWHNWKFRLADGACILGGEDVRRYGIREQDGRVQVDLSPPPVERQLAKLEQGLARAFREDDWGHAAREVERMLELGRTANEVLAFGCAHAARRARYGFDHGQAAAADYAALAARFPEEGSLAVTEALHGLIHPHVRRSQREFEAPEPLAVTPGAQGFGPLGVRLRDLIEAEDLKGAQALFRGALQDGVPPEVVLGWLAAAASDHFLDFGHAAIYVVKADELLRRIGWAAAHPVLTSLVTRLVNGTREDLLPYMRAYRSRWPVYAGQLAGWAERSARVEASVDVDAFEGAILGASLEDALDAVAHALDAGLAADRVALLLAHAASRRLLAFDAAIQADDSLSEGWLHATHTLTHADAVRESLLRWPGADALRGLFHSARFIHHIGPLMGPTPEVASRPGDVEAALSAQDPEAVLAHSAHALDVDPHGYAQTLARGCLFTPLTLPIFVQHHVKTVLAAERISLALAGDPTVGGGARFKTPWLATARFLAHPLRERRIRDGVRWARDFVREGKMRPNLLGY